MKLSVRLKDIDNTDGLKEHIERRLSFATDRFSARIVELSVVVYDVNGPRGGSDKRCTIRGILEGGKSISVEDQGEDASVVVNCAVRRLSSSIARALFRAHQCRASVMHPERFDAAAA